MSKKFRSDAMAAVHEAMAALHKVGVIDKQTMRRFDDACLTPAQRPEVFGGVPPRKTPAHTATHENRTSRPTNRISG